MDHQRARRRDHGTKGRRARTGRSVAVVAAGAVLLGAACSGDSSDGAESTGSTPGTTAPATTSTAYQGKHATAATIEGPVTGGRGRAWRAEPDLAGQGWVEEEYFASGTAPNGPYKVRFLVRRPADPARFNGTVVTEWMNVTAGFEFDVDWGLFKQELLRSGYAYVGVGAQRVGIENRSTENRFGPYPGLKELDPDRYGSLVHPGDEGAAEIFSQIGHAVRTDPRVLGGLAVARQIATGQSQSAGALARYLATVHADALVYDAFFLHSGFGDTTNPTDTPVLRFNSEFEAALRARTPQSDGPNYRYWEVAGTGHTPVTSLGGVRDSFQREGRESGLPCDYPTAEVPTVEYAGHAALDALNRWLTTGTPPPSMPMMELDGANVAKDADGNGKGGIRLPHVEAPLGRHLASNTPTSNPNCLLTPGYDAFDGQPAGTTPADEWAEPALAERYPSRQAYVDAVKAAAERAREQGWLLPPDVDALVAAAGEVSLPG